MLGLADFDELTAPLSELYDRLAVSIIKDMVRRLAGMEMTSAAAWQMQRLIESGQVYETVIRKIGEQLQVSDQLLMDSFKKAGVKSIRFDRAIYRAAGFKDLPLNLSPQMLKALVAGLKKTGGLLRNLTMTLANTSQEAFIDAADLAYMQVHTGTMDYISAIRQAAIGLAKDGAKVVNYPSGHQDHVDVAMRRAVLTGVTQTVSEMQMALIEEMDVDLIAVSAHYGARNEGTGPANHEQWQGRVYTRKGNPGYPDFFTVTGYGTGEGLSGWNCRHSFYPFFEGLEIPYTEDQLDEFANQFTTVNGETVDYYEASQIQRRIERDIRHWKRQAEALGAAGQENWAEMEKVRFHQAEMRRFVNETDFLRQSEREGPRVRQVGKRPVPPKVMAVARADSEKQGYYLEDAGQIFPKTGKPILLKTPDGGWEAFDAAMMNADWNVDVDEAHDELQALFDEEDQDLQNRIERFEAAMAGAEGDESEDEAARLEADLAEDEELLLKDLIEDPDEIKLTEEEIARRARAEKVKAKREAAAKEAMEQFQSEPVEMKVRGDKPFIELVETEPYVLDEDPNRDKGAFPSERVKMANGQWAMKKKDALYNGMNLSVRESVAYRIDQELGLEIVPETIYSQQERASFQVFIENAKTGSKAPVGSLVDPEEVSKTMLLDGLIGNYDRHTGNWLVAKGHLIAIDNGLTFRKEKDLATFMVNECRFALPDWSPFRWRGRPRRMPLSSRYKDKLLELIGDGLTREDGGDSWLGRFDLTELSRAERVAMIERAKLIIWKWDDIFIEPEK